MEWNGTSKLFSELFLPILKPDGTALERVYLYCISKKVDGSVYVKVGEGTRSQKRLGDAQTYLVPGKGTNRGFKVHRLFFWPLSPYRAEYSTLIEKECHKHLRKEFPAYTIEFASGNKSEWYKPRSIPAFLKYVEGLVAVQSPKPESAWAFDARSKKSILRSLKADRKFEKFRKNHERVLQQIRIERKLAGDEKLKTRGSSAYFMDRLLGEEFRDDGRLWKISGASYSKGLDRYLLEYKPARITSRTSEADRAGYETQFVEVMDWIGPARTEELGLTSNVAYWKKKLSGGGAAWTAEGAWDAVLL